MKAKQLNPGNSLHQKIKSPGKLFTTVFVVGFCLIFIPACSRPYISSFERTATAVSTQVIVSGSGGNDPSTPVASEISPTVEPTETVQVTEDTAPTFVQPTPSVNNTALPPVIYTSQAGDYLQAVAARFGVKPEDIKSGDEIPTDGLITPGQVLIIPDVLDIHTSTTRVLPDSEVVFSPSALDFNTQEYVNEAGGYLKDYKEYLSSGWANGAQVINRVAIENSINPRILLALVEYRSHWVYGQPVDMDDLDYPLGYVNSGYPRLYHQLSWAVSQLSLGYYGWRAGIMFDLTFPNRETLRIAPELNAGSVALHYLFSKFYDQGSWNEALFGEQSLPILYEKMFGDPWARAQTVEPLYPTSLKQPDFVLPYMPGHTWEYTGGPHSAWGPDGALAAIDFAPSTDQVGCNPSVEWTTAIGPGVVIRSGNGIVMVDMDGDGYEQTGWNILYLHIASEGRIPVGTTVSVDDRIGHPSCEGGRATGTHLHIARKYNGEWILADGPAPFVLSGWRVIAGDKPYIGYLVKDNVVVEANQFGASTASIPRLLK